MPRSEKRSELLGLRARAEVSRAALDHNWRLLLEQARSVLLPGATGACLLPMVKADAYGHGARWAALGLLELHRRAGRSSALAGLGVATLFEAIEVREAIGVRGRALPVVVFSGTLPWNEASGTACLRHDLTPVISTIEDWRKFKREGWVKTLRFELKFNTGMNRLGISMQHLQEVRRDLAALASRGIHPAGIFSHLAMGEDPRAELSLRQMGAFRALHAALKPIVADSTDFHLGNSAALWQGSEWGLNRLTTRARPGLSLYGIEPREAVIRRRASGRRLKPVMELLAPVVALQQLRSGDQVGYGGRFVAPRSMKVAILGMGYADGLPRLWGMEGSGAVARIGSHDCPWLGAVSMDLSVVRASAGVRTGSQAKILGTGVDIWRQADAAGTIPYELLTSLSARVQRIYG